MARTAATTTATRAMKGTRPTFSRAAAALLALALLLLGATRPSFARVADEAPHCCCPAGAHGADHASAARAELHKTCACAIAPHDGPRTAPPTLSAAPALRDAFAIAAPPPVVVAPAMRPMVATPLARAPWTPPPRSLYALRTLLTV